MKLSFALTMGACLMAFAQCAPAGAKTAGTQTGTQAGTARPAKASNTPQAPAEWQEFDLLQGRASVSMPKGTRRIMRDGDLMGLQPSAMQEERLFYDRGDKRMVFFIEEKLTLADKGYPDSELKLMEQLNEGGEVFRFGKIGQDVTYAIRKVRLEPGKTEGFDYVVANLRHTDGTLQRVRIQFTESFCADHDECVKLAEQAIQSLKAGKRTLDVAARKQSLKSYQPGCHYELDVPQGYACTQYDSGGFYVACFKKPVDRASKPEAMLSVFVGDHPGMTYTEYNLTPKDAVREWKAPLCGGEATWRLFDIKDQKSWLLEGLAPAGTRGGERIFLHITINALTRGEAEQMMQVAQTMKLLTADGKLVVKPQQPVIPEKAKLIRAEVAQRILEIQGILAGVKDKATAKAADKRLKQIAKQVENAEEKLDELMTDFPDIYELKDEITAEFQTRLDPEIQRLKEVDCYGCEELKRILPR